MRLYETKMGIENPITKEEGWIPCIFDLDRIEEIHPFVNIDLKYEGTRVQLWSGVTFMIIDNYQEFKTLWQNSN